MFDRLEYDLTFTETPKVIFDCGANIEMTSVYFANRFPDATIIAIEPETENYKILLRNTEGYTNVRCLNYGVWNKMASLQVIDRGEGAWAFIVKETENETPGSIQAISIDEVMKTFNVKKLMF